MAKNAGTGEPLFVRQDIGSGRPIVLLHGMLSDGSQWRVVAGLLSDYYRVIVVDLLGHGTSPRPKNARYTPREHSLALRKTLEKLGATDDLTIVGYSIGGVVALNYAADYPGVSQLCMISTPFYLKAEEMVASGYANSLLFTKLSLLVYRQIDRLLKKNDLTNKLSEKEGPTKWLHGIVDTSDNKFDSEITRLNLKNLIIEFEFAKTLQKVTSPITFYSGKRDVFVVQGQLIALKKIQPLMEVETLSCIKNDHLLVEHLPEQIAQVLTRYQKRLLHVNSDTGKGEVLVLLHGIESSSSYWNNVLKILAKKYRVITIDLLGFGESPKPHNIAYSLEDQVAWLKRTLDSEGIAEFTLIGHSLGALVAMAYTATHPRQIQRLLMVAPVFINDGVHQKRFLIRRLNYIEYFSDTGYLVSTISKTVGKKKVAKFIPTIRSVTNAVKEQHSLRLAKKIRNVPTTIIYGEKDQLVDDQQLHAVAKILRKSNVMKIGSVMHNFSLYQPKILLDAIDPNINSANAKISVSRLKPNQVLVQLVTLAAPILFFKGILYIAAGLLLFSQYKEETLLAGVLLLVMIHSFQFIHSSFSLENERLSYIGYVSLGMLGVLFGFVITNHFNFSLKLALMIVCGYIILNGVSRILAAMLWTTNKTLHRRQLLTGTILFIVSLSAMLGSMVSVRAIVSALAIFLIVRGLTFGSYLLISIAAAFARGH